MKDLKTLRDEINAVDTELLKLLNARANIAVEVGHIKAKMQETSIYNPVREKEVIANVLKQNQGPLRENHLEQIFIAIMSSCRDLEQQIKVAYVGHTGDLNHQALLKHFGEAVVPIGVKDISEAFQQIEARKVEFAVVAIHSPETGIVADTLDELLNSSMRIIGEVILGETRYFVLGKVMLKPSGSDKTSVLVMNIPNSSGALLKLVEPFARAGVSISLPSLRPSKQESWHYVFYFDVEGHEQDAKVIQALDELNAFALVKVLGSYPKVQAVF